MNETLEKKKSYVTPVGVLMVLAVVNIIMLIIFLIHTRGQFLSEVVQDARFPAFAYMFYYFLSCIIPEQIKNSNVSDWYNMYMVIILCICVVCICETVSRMLECSYSSTIVFVLIFILSHTFALSEVKAANSAVYVLTPLVMALYLKDSDSRIGREAALILIAAAAGFKVAPAIFGFLYIKEKRYKEAARLVVYGIVFSLPRLQCLEGLKVLRIS